LWQYDPNLGASTVNLTTCNFMISITQSSR
jgi:hypothetical protein